MLDAEQQGDQERPERRLMVRYPSKASTSVIRESDVMRMGIDAVLKDISGAGLGVIMKTPLRIGEQIKLSLRNEIQRLQKETRGVVRHVTEHDDGTYDVGIELTARLTPLEVSLLRMGIPKDSATDQPTWI